MAASEKSPADSKVEGLDVLVIFSARGENSFNQEQLNRFSSVAHECGVVIRFIPVAAPLSDQEFCRFAADATWLAFTRRATLNFHAEMIDQLPLLRGISVYATGYEWLDLAHLNEKSVGVSYLPDYSALTVAEHTLGIILLLLRRLHLAYDRVRGVVPQGVSLRGSELTGKTVGIIGFGTIAHALLPMLLPFKLDLLISDLRDISAEVKDIDPGKSHISVTDSATLFRQSDIVVLLADTKRGAPPVVGENEIGMMKKGVWLVNTARPQLVDHKALHAALDRGDLAGYGVDDTIPDLLSAGEGYGRVYQSGHTGWYSDQAILRGTSGWVENIVAMVKGEPLNRVPGNVSQGIELNR